MSVSDGELDDMVERDLYELQIEQAAKRLERLTDLYKVEGQMLGLMSTSSPAYRVTVDRMQAIAELMRSAERAIREM